MPNTIPANTVLRIDEKDNVVTCLKDLSAGQILDLESGLLPVKENVPIFHKIALFAIKQGDLCYKYGQIIGRATRDIAPGEYVHVHNLDSTRGRGDLVEGKGGTGQ